MLRVALHVAEHISYPYAACSIFTDSAGQDQIRQPGKEGDAFFPSPHLAKNVLQLGAGGFAGAAVTAEMFTIVKNQVEVAPFTFALAGSA